jgi:hypothetical protein
MIILLLILNALFSADIQPVNSDDKGYITQSHVTDSLYSSLLFDTTVLNCDTIEEGVQYEFAYHFTNIGDAPLILISVKSSCGCYVPRWTREPILPGGRGVIIGKYNSRGRPGNFVKSMTVASNDPFNPNQMLICKGYTKRKIE